MAQTISGPLIAHVRMIFNGALAEATRGKVTRNGYNVFASVALPSYVLAVAAVEAFINETLLGDMARVHFPQSPLWAVPDTSMDRLDICTKLVIVPQMLVGSSFERGTLPYQDFAVLVKVRNAIVHYKMDHAVPKWIKPLSDRKVAFTPPKGIDYDWVWKMSCTEGIRWAHNSACAVAAKLVEFVPEARRPELFLDHLIQNFPPIPDAFVAKWFERNLPPEKVVPAQQSAPSPPISS